MTTKDEKHGPSRIELAKALKQVKAVATAEQYAQVAALLTGSASEAEAAETPIRGMSQEDEFVVLSMAMGTATHLAPLEQRPSIAAGSWAPDILARFQPRYRPASPTSIYPQTHDGYRCLVEIKSTQEEKVKYKGSALSGLRAFADSFGLPLLFAVRFSRYSNNAMWAVVEDRDRQKASITITMADIASPLRAILWNDYLLFLRPKTFLVCSYDSSESTTASRHPKYGVLSSLEIHMPSTTYKAQPPEMLMFSMFFENFNKDAGVAEPHGMMTRVTYRLRNTVASVGDLLFGLNRLARDSAGNRLYDPTRALRQMADRQSPLLINRDVVEAVCARMSEIGAVIPAQMANAKELDAAWIKTGGKPPQTQSS